jgi:hypothetical protein
MCDAFRLLVAIYSRREEYVLLQPKFVLPEFFMHVQFPADDILSQRIGESE